MLLGGAARAGKRLRSSSGWYEDNGADDLSFSALPVDENPPMGVNVSGRTTSFWSSEEGGRYAVKYDAKCMSFSMDRPLGSWDWEYKASIWSCQKRIRHSVRCLKDSVLSLDGNERSASGGTITDSRDGQIYKIIRIGNREWMADNLNFSTSTNSKCYGDKHYNCKKYGRLYDKDGISLSICPDGFKVPSYDDLVNVSGSQSFKETVKNDVFKHYFWTAEKKLIPTPDLWLIREAKERYFPVRCVRE